MREKEQKELIETMQNKHKQQMKQKEEKARAETRNQVDVVKNEMARLRVEYEREKKRLLSEAEDRLEQYKRQAEETL